MSKSYHFRPIVCLIMIHFLIIFSKQDNGKNPTPMQNVSPNVRDLLAKIVSNLKNRQKPNNSKPERQNFLEMAKDTLEKVVSRHLMIDKLMDKVMVPRSDHHPLVMPMSIPQISDARITIQNFNPPPMPLTSGMLPQDKYQYDVKIPENTSKSQISAIQYHTPVQKNMNLIMPGSYDKDVQKIIREAFDDAMKKHLAKHQNLNVAGSIYKLNVFDSPTNRLLNEKDINHRIGKVFERINGLKSNYMQFQKQVDEKMHRLSFLLEKNTSLKLNYITDSNKE